MSNKLLNSLQLKGFLSFGQGSKPVGLTNLNVLIGPNGVGKSNFIEAIELLHATPGDFSGAIRIGGTPSDWIWHGDEGGSSARLEAQLAPLNSTPELRYGIEFTESAGRLEIIDEVLEEAVRVDPRAKDVRFYYRFQNGHPAINVSETGADPTANRRYRQRKLKRESIDPTQSILSQRKEPDLYPEVAATANRFGSIQLYREWSFGRSAPLRRPQSGDLPTDELLPQLVNLGLVLNDLEHRNDWDRFNRLMTRFLPRYKRLTTKIAAGSVQIFLHEDGLSTPVPASRLSDGTLRFLSILAILFNAASASLLCIEEPELGLHPDVISLLADRLVEASEKTQLVVTTHSDVLVSALTEQVESVLVCEYLEQGTTLRRLDAGKLEHWLREYRLGEIWQSGKLGGNLW
jgi:predicted ATPase